MPVTRCDIVFTVITLILVWYTDHIVYVTQQTVRESLFLLGGDEWKQLAERLGMSCNEIRFIDKRTTNPCDVVLNLMAEYRYFSVGELYDKLVESELPGSADLL